MRTSIEIDDELIACAMIKTGAKTKREAVQIALLKLVKGAPDYSGVLKMFGSGALTAGYDPKNPAGATFKRRPRAA